MFPELREHLDQRADLTTELIKDGFASMAPELTTFKSERNNTHATINILLSFLITVVAALRNEDLNHQTEMVMAEIDQLIKPMSNRSYDPALTRLRRRQERELTERQKYSCFCVARCVIPWVTMGYEWDTRNPVMG